MSVQSLLLYSFCSYDGDVDIDALVKEPITAGVKGLKVGNSTFYCSLHFPCNHHHHHYMCSLVGLKLSCIFQLKGMMRVILEPLIGEAPLVGGVTLFFIRRPVSDIFHYFTALVPNQKGLKPTKGPSKLHRGVARPKKNIQEAFISPSSPKIVI